MKIRHNGCLAVYDGFIIGDLCHIEGGESIFIVYEVTLDNIKVAKTNSNKIDFNSSLVLNKSMIRELKFKKLSA